ncbi:MAG: DUF547 domain-containing protein [Bacteroidetes bacterium]|nr:MAG: DUF547 domain-containing protein [Bacteroidota bacterium]
MRLFSFIFPLLLLASCGSKNVLTPDDPEAFSIRLLTAVRNGSDTAPYQDTLKKSDLEVLENGLKSDEEKKSFWINLYNAFVQIELDQLNGSYSSKDALFNAKNISIASENISLNDIENSILRRKSALFNDKLSPSKLDNRIHFALNCGAASCPPISYYHSSGIEDQLEQSEDLFIRGTSKYDPINNTLEISEIFDWYKDDFGSQSGILQLMSEKGIIPLYSNPTIQFKPYDWTITEPIFIE